MPICETKLHGTLQFEPEQVLKVPDGLFGFPAETQFLLIEIPSRRPLVFVQSIGTPHLCFYALPAQVIDQNYRLQMTEVDIEALGYHVQAPPQMGKDLLCLALLSIDENNETRGNLLAPLLIDIASHTGRQVIVMGEYSHQAPFSVAELQAC